MPWLSPRSIKFDPPKNRNIWYFRKELKRYTKKQPTEINFNASLWKWLYSWLEYLWKYRKDQYSFIPKALGPIPLPAGRSIYENSASFTQWIQYITPHIFGVRCVNIKGEAKVLPIKFTKGVKLPSNTLTFYTIDVYERLLGNGDIAWCSINKDWYTHDCFRSLYDWQGTQKRLLRVANPKVFTCPTCRSEFFATSNNQVRNPYTKLLVCPSCKDSYPRNPAPTNSSIYGDYHSHYRTGWQFFPHFAKGDSTIPMGIELEMQSKVPTHQFDPRSIAWNMCLHQQAADPNWNLFYCERDGSIGEYGLEMITQPMSQQFHYKFWSHMLPMIREHFVGWNTKNRHPGGMYGIHITFDSSLFGQLNVARLAKFIENKKNQVFVQGIAQRGVLYGATSALAARDKKVSDVFLYDKGKLQGSAQRNQAINLKKEKGLCEIRMYRSTLNTTSFFKNLEFLWAFHHWCGETPWNFSHENFIDWLLDNPKFYNRYPHLYEYMCHAIFPVDNAQWSTENPWHPAFVRLVDQLKKGQKDLFLSFSPETTDYTP